MCDFERLSFLPVCLGEHVNLNAAGGYCSFADDGKYTVCRTVNYIVLSFQPRSILPFPFEVWKIYILRIEDMFSKKGKLPPIWKLLFLSCFPTISLQHNLILDPLLGSPLNWLFKEFLEKDKYLAGWMKRQN